MRILHIGVDSLSRGDMHIPRHARSAHAIRGHAAWTPMLVPVIPTFPLLSWSPTSKTTSQSSAPSNTTCTIHQCSATTGIDRIVTMASALRDVTPFLLVLIVVSTLGPLQFGFHLVSPCLPVCLAPSSTLTRTGRVERTRRCHSMPQKVHLDAPKGRRARHKTKGDGPSRLHSHG